MEKSDAFTSALADSFRGDKDFLHDGSIDSIRSAIRAGMKRRCPDMSERIDSIPTGDGESRKIFNICAMDSQWGVDVLSRVMESDHPASEPSTSLPCLEDREPKCKDGQVPRVEGSAPATTEEAPKHGSDAELDHAYLSMLSMMSMFPDRVLSIRVGSVSITID